MKKRVNILISLSVSAITMLAPARAFATEEAPVHALSSSSDPAQPDTLVYSATKDLIESFGEMSKTASKLSETALKLLKAQEELEKKAKNNTQTPAKGEQKILNKSSNGVYIEEDIVSTPIVTVPNSATSVAESPAGTIPSSEEDITIEETPHSGTQPNGVYIGSLWDLPLENNDTTGKDGKYIWVPNDKLQDVESFINSDISIPDAKYYNSKKPNLNEMVLWHGDSIPMAIPTKRLGRYDRKLYNWLIYPKGIWHISLSANYGELSTDDSEFLSLIQDVDLKGKIYSIKPSVSYFLRNNLCMGLRLAFTKGDMAINSFKVDIDEDMSFDLHDIKYTSDSYSAAIFVQQYFGLSRRGRFAVFNEAEISIGTGSSHFIRPFDGEIRDTRTKTQSFNINYSPGVSIMMMKNAAFNLSFGIFGFHLKDEKQWENGEDAGSRFTSGINFRFNLFNINFGVSIII